jgi:hypothetical protein
MPDCLICLEKTSNIWIPPTPCSCRPNMHKACWKKWTLQAGDMCIICRRAPTEISAQPPIHINYVFYMAHALILTIIFLAMNHTQINVHDEL